MEMILGGLPHSFSLSSGDGDDDAVVIVMVVIIILLQGRLSPQTCMK